MGDDWQAVPGRRSGRGRLWLSFGLFVLVLVVDQGAKWWGWRHVSGSIINGAGDWFVGQTVGGWYADPVVGTVLDLLAVAVVVVALWILIRRYRPVGVLALGALMIGGWSSNLLDRLGMHAVTAPGSVRGAVDFILLGDEYYNVADFVIASATPLFLLALARQGWHAGAGARLRIPALAGAVGFMALTAARAAPHGL